MRFLLAGLVLVHALIHLMGFAKAFRLAALPNLAQAFSRAVRLTWLAAALLLGMTVVMLLLGHDWWWLVGMAALVLSQALIVHSWRDARFGTIVNVMIAVPVLIAALEARPGSFTNRYRAAAREALAGSQAMPPVSEADLAHLPDSVRRYLRYVGVVGNPRVRNFRAAFRGDFRNGLEGRWMSFRSEQVNVVEPPSRLFLMKASMFGVPIEGLHMFRSDGASMRIGVASLFRVAEARGPKMDQGETVTLFNDLCLMAPAALIDDRRIRWDAVGPLSARAAFTHNGYTITARLSFNEAGELIDFESGDRFMSSDGKSYQKLPWSTPAGEYREFDGRRVASHVEVVWHTRAGPFLYGEFHLVAITYNVTNAE